MRISLVVNPSAPTPYSLLPTPYSLLPTPLCDLQIPQSINPTTHIV
ncbi:hypothetical protein [Moorena sp. SIO3I6]|nr:hypothetical protein [Moorena sp. SIO3I6]NEP21190.1 hypothetical protein [Moorena sp. SIO3I6]